MTFTSGANQDGTSALPAEVLQTAWTLRNFNGNAEAGPDVAAAGITIKFEADGTFDGFSACNNYFGSYTVTGQQITIGDNIGATRMACPAAATALESRYLTLLPTVKSYTATATELHLIYGDDGAALVYVSGSGESPAAAPPVTPASGAGMPNTGGGTPLITLLLVLGSLVALVTGFALRNARAKKR
jgi:heat shock protein HslJ